METGRERRAAAIRGKKTQYSHSPNLPVLASTKPKFEAFFIRNGLPGSGKTVSFQKRGAALCTGSCTRSGPGCSPRMSRSSILASTARQVPTLPVT
jgi:hypothetical protein